VAPLTAEGRAMMAKREWLENEVRARVGNDLVERARDWRYAYGAILVGDERKDAKPRLLIKDEYGWYEVQPGRTERLPMRAGHELNRLLLDEALWWERPYRSERACRGTARLFILRHAGKEQFGREPCGSVGLAGRAAEVAATRRVPPGMGRTTSEHIPDVTAGRMPQGQRDFTRQIFHRLSDMAAAWERKILTAFVDPYSEDVIVERPEGVLRGRKAVVDWARRRQDWSSPGMGSQLTMHQASMPPVQGDLFYGTHEMRWEEEGRPVRQTFSTLWRNNAGLWQIVHERVSLVKPVEERRPR
jgi:ketosteroid isomerase-like protein